MERFSWIKDIVNIEQHLKEIDYPKNGTLKLFVEKVMNSNGGLDTLCKVYEAFNKSDVVFNNSVIEQLAKIYVRQNSEIDVHQLSRILGVHTRTIYSWKKNISSRIGGRRSLFN